jgi:hypothetical protein
MPGPFVAMPDVGPQGLSPAQGSAPGPDGVGAPGPFLGNPKEPRDPHGHGQGHGHGPPIVMPSASLVLRYTSRVLASSADPYRWTQGSRLHRRARRSLGSGPKVQPRDRGLGFQGFRDPVHNPRNPKTLEKPGTSGPRASPHPGARGQGGFCLKPLKPLNPAILAPLGTPRHPSACPGMRAGWGGVGWRDHPQNPPPSSLHGSRG